MMKKLTAIILLILCIGTTWAVDLGSLQFIDTLLRLPGPVAPFVFEDCVVFTAPSSYRRMGISFAHDGYSKVHWFQRLMLPEDPAIIAAGGKNAELWRDAGIMFHTEIMPAGIDFLDYRVIIDGLWVTDPLNPQIVRGSAGINISRVTLPARSQILPVHEQNTSRGVLFSYRAAPGETVTVAGSFNNWDPFMYELRETSPGLYTLSLALPPGSYQYVFFHRGERITDPGNIQRLYYIDGKAVSEVTVR